MSSYYRRHHFGRQHRWKAFGFCAIGAMRRMKTFVPTDTLETVYKILVQPHFDYIVLIFKRYSSVTQSECFPPQARYCFQQNRCYSKRNV